MPAQSPIAPGTWGYDPAFKSEMSEYNPARAKALLDLYGYVDRDGDGWRELPDGKPLVLEYATQPDQTSRQLDELWKKNMDAHRHAHRVQGGQVAREPEGQPRRQADDVGRGLERRRSPMPTPSWRCGYGPNKGQANHARFDLPAFNALYERQRVLPDGPERQALIDEAKKLMVAYMPYKVHVHRICTDLCAALGGRLPTATSSCASSGSTSTSTAADAGAPRAR